MIATGISNRLSESALPASTVTVVTCLLAFVRWRWCRLGVLHSFSLECEYNLWILHRHCLLQENLLVCQTYWLSNLYLIREYLYLIRECIQRKCPLLRAKQLVDKSINMQKTFNVFSLWMIWYTQCCETNPQTTNVLLSFRVSQSIILHGC